MPFPWVKVSPQQIPLKQLSGSSLKVMLFLAALIDEELSVRIPTASIASFFSCSRRSVIRSLRELYAVGILEKLSTENEALKVRFRKCIKAGKGSPGEETGSVRDNVVWGDLGHFKKG